MNPLPQSKQLAAKITAKKHAYVQRTQLGLRLPQQLDPIGGEVHDVFSGHSDETRKAHTEQAPAFLLSCRSQVYGVPAMDRCALHHIFRPPLANELRQRERAQSR